MTAKGSSPSWWRKGFLNTFEHGLTRVADALTTMVLLWTLTPEVFSKLALGQALVAPVLFFFLSPETVIYRDFSKWKEEGDTALSTRIAAFRRFAWTKAGLAVVLSAGLAFAISGESPWEVRFLSLIWAFGLALAPQIAGPDREFLRLDLRLRQLNALTLYQKFVLLAGTAFVSFLFPGKVGLLALVSVFSALSTAGLARWMARPFLTQTSPLPAGFPSTTGFWMDSLKTFSLWQHVSGVIHNWTLTMDLFFLGMFRFPAREVGLYAAVLKLSNFSLALPLALGNLFSIWVGRRPQEASRQEEHQFLAKYSLVLLAVCGLQWLALMGISPWIFEWLSRGRWSAAELLEMRNWFAWILGGGVLLGTTLLMSSWLFLRTPLVRLIMNIHLPWGVAAIGIYGFAVSSGGTSSAAIANVGVMAVHLILVFRFYWKTRASTVQ